MFGFEFHWQAHCKGIVFSQVKTLFVTPGVLMPHKFTCFSPEQE